MASNKSYCSACAQNRILCIAPHPHAQENNIPNIAHVAKIESTTMKRAPKQTPIAKCNLALKPSCGSLEISTSRKEKSKANRNPNCLQNLDATSSKPKQTQTTKQALLPSL
jgi:hypothetical protein